MPEPIIVRSVFIGGDQGDIEDPNNWRYDTIPTCWAICDTCRGEGRHSNNLGAFSQEDMEEMGEDFREDYMAGYYDSFCENCHGTGKIIIPDVINADKELLNLYLEDLEVSEYIDSLSRQERNFEMRSFGGYYDV